MTKGMTARAYIGGRDLRATGPCRPWGGRQAPVARWVGDRPFFFARDLVANLKKKNYSYGLSPYGGRQALSVIFFLQICNEVHGKKKQGGLSPPQRATGACRPPQGRQGPPPYISPGRHSLVI